MEVRFAAAVWHRTRTRIAGSLAREAQDYLAAVELVFDGVPVERTVRFGTPAVEIMKEARAFNADLIACTTGSRRVLGRVARQLIRHAETPVLLFREAS